MEGLIIVIVMYVLSSLFSKSKKEEKQKPTKPMPPFSSQPAPRQQQEVRPAQQKQPKTLEDFANEIFGQLNEKVKPVEKTVEAPTSIEVEIPKREVSRETTRPALQTEFKPSSRGLTERPIAQIVKRQEVQPLQFVPSNKRELMQAIVMSEILGKPKAKR